MEVAKIRDLHQAALNYAEVRNERSRLAKEELTLKAEVLALMKKNKKDSYFCDGVEVFAQGKTIKIKVWPAKEREIDEPNERFGSTSQPR